ncbi:Thylakoid lumenal protein [Monoraphidium neglectum]|uniref:Thylakoid lumenal protein n=1 Tax=Monoraphidium neglectum TaxID=145388 RepID=A0A0D2MAI3_9CHLO|nr:Thylakoid lumenal protein [Monoraphidium neglectum]KIZ00295.1 Thylakoid lumenal protein [Monoraphidium neglectum]|eukprot:XP_013899314.1 Thylakoid lumenal protein [Monoraphidium neglectum]
MQTVARTQRAFGAPSSLIKPKISTSVSRAVVVKAKQQHDAALSSRREILAGSTLAAVMPAFLAQLPAKADSEYKTFLGLASPPTSYGGYGGNANEEPKYSFEYPPEWKSEVPSKVEKGTQGVDGRVVNPKGKDQRAFVITLGRAGEDNKSFRLTDLDSTFAGFAGADYYLQARTGAGVEGGGMGRGGRRAAGKEPRF